MYFDVNVGVGLCLIRFCTCFMFYVGFVGKEMASFCLVINVYFTCLGA